VAESLGQMAFADCNFTDNESRCVFGKVATGSQIVGEGAVELWQSVELERSSVLVVRKLCAAQSHGEFLLITPAMSLIGTPDSRSFKISTVCAPANLDFLHRSSRSIGESNIACVRDGGAHAVTERLCTPPARPAIIRGGVSDDQTSLRPFDTHRATSSSRPCQAYSPNY